MDSSIRLLRSGVLVAHRVVYTILLRPRKVDARSLPNADSLISQDYALVCGTFLAPSGIVGQNLGHQRQPELGHPRGLEDGMPRGHQCAAASGWSHACPARLLWMVVAAIAAWPNAEAI